MYSMYMYISRGVGITIYLARTNSFYEGLDRHEDEGEIKFGPVIREG